MATRDAVDLLAALVQFGHAQEDAAVFLQREIVLHDDAGDFDETGIVQQHRAENKSLGVDIGGKALFESLVVGAVPG